MNASNWIGLLGAIGALITAVFAAVHGQRVDNRAANKDQQQLEAYIMDQVKQDNQQLRDDREADRKKFADELNDLSAKLTALGVKKDAMENELNQQIALKVRENEQLKQRNAGLERENQEYRDRYGEL
ncbi:hypothetical protein [Levilactobacillus acidifarinae]|uniref:hypothetical protein n=1 Tax=Levilactobacillus acidifarinae TaxID=267364 RepID=UPI00070C2325|nr:hypothetical protein [Levilactobacillus acidifarinae]GEO70419.1 hypothetical protein LAC03_23290 [Levilactobacillus acidifarinae]